MLSQIILLSVFIASISSTNPTLEEIKDNEPPAFTYKYKINDPKTGDHKTHHETRTGDLVKGYYSFTEADGTLREVHYTADKVNGFKAVVKNSGKPQVPNVKPFKRKLELSLKGRKGKSSRNLFDKNFVIIRKQISK